MKNGKQILEIEIFVFFLILQSHAATFIHKIGAQHTSLVPHFIIHFRQDNAISPELIKFWLFVLPQLPKGNQFTVRESAPIHVKPAIPIQEITTRNHLFMRWVRKEYTKAKVLDIRDVVVAGIVQAADDGIMIRPRSPRMIVGR